MALPEPLAAYPEPVKKCPNCPKERLQALLDARAIVKTTWNSRVKEGAKVRDIIVEIDAWMARMCNYADSQIPEEPEEKEEESA